MGDLDKLAKEEEQEKKDGGMIYAIASNYGESDFEDMILMDRLTESAILDNLSNRYRKNKIYTFIGSVLVALNPLAPLPLYGPDVAAQYRPSLKPPSPPPPAHIFAVAARALGDVIRAGRSQCALVNGESGAGKTESAKLVLRHLVECGGGGGAAVEQRILDADPVLEAFGNARTVRNHNSSRFGKFVDLTVSRHGRGLLGGRVDHFLLERSRVVRQAEGERGFHVFYFLLAGLDHEGRSSRQLSSSPLDFAYTHSVPTTDDDDRHGFHRLYSSLAVLAFSPEEIAALWSLLGSVLHLGNIELRDSAPDDRGAGCVPTGLSHPHAAAAARLMGLREERLVGSLVRRTRQTRLETLVSPVDAAAATAARDALAKAVYGRLFDWLVARINAAVQREAPARPEEGAEGRVGILDIFGFENMTRNSFEQLCINFANEVLHQYFLNQLFKVEQAECAREGVDWTPIDFEDNQAIIDLLAGPSVSVMALLDDVARLSAGSDDTLVRQLHAARQNDPSYARPRADVDSRFMVKHFAGKVIYAAEGMVEKNRDELSLSLVQLLEESTNSYLRLLFEGESERRRRPTLVNRFRHSVDALMTKIRSREAHFVRCVKPNEAMTPGYLDLDLCMRQLRYLGVKDTVRVRRSGYAVRYPMDEFVKIYSCLLPSSGPTPPPPDACRAVCASLDPAGWALGRTKVFLRLPADDALQRRRCAALAPRVVLLQSLWRRVRARRRFLELRGAALRLQSRRRAVLIRRRFLRLRAGVLRLQALARARELARRHLRATAAETPSEEEKTSAADNPPRQSLSPVPRPPQPPVQLSFTFRSPDFGPCRWRLRLPQVLPDPPPDNPGRRRAMVEFRVDAVRPRARGDELR